MPSSLAMESQLTEFEMNSKTPGPPGLFCCVGSIPWALQGKLCSQLWQRQGGSPTKPSWLSGGVCSSAESRSTWQGQRGDTRMPKGHGPAESSAQARGTHWHTGLCCGAVARAGGTGRSWGHCRSYWCLLAYFVLHSVFPGMYSGSSSSSHSGPSPAVLPAPHDIPARHLPLDPALPSPHHHQSPLESARDGYVCHVRVLGLLGLHLIMEDCIVYFTLHGCCSKENTGLNKAVLFGLESWNNFVFKGPQKVESSMPCAEQGKLGHHYQVVQGLVLAFDKTQWDFFLHSMQLHLDSNFVF